MTFTPETISKLDCPLDPKHVKKPSGSFGPKGDYIEGWHAIAEANRIFGFDGWSYSVDLMRDSLVEGVDSRSNPQWQAAYTCICTVEAGGVRRQDVGFGSGFAKGVGDAIEGATKEAVTDALKRCLRTFGHPFGLALYDKTREHVQAAPEPLPADVEDMLAQIKACDTLEALNLWKAQNGRRANASSHAGLIVGEWSIRKEGIEQVMMLRAG